MPNDCFMEMRIDRPLRVMVTRSMSTAAPVAVIFAVASWVSVAAMSPSNVKVSKLVVMKSRVVVAGAAISGLSASAADRGRAANRALVISEGFAHCLALGKGLRVFVSHEGYEGTKTGNW